MPATKDSTETDFAHEDVQEMDLDELLETAPEDTAAVQAIDERIGDLEARLDSAEPDTSAVQEAKENLDAAKEHLDDTRTSYELGNADEEDVQTAEAAVKAAKEEFDQAKAEAEEEAMPQHRRKAIRSTLSRLEDEREAAVESARKALGSRAQALRDQLARTAHEAFAEALDATRRLRRLQTYANHEVGDGRRSVLSHSHTIPKRLQPFDRTNIDILKRGAEEFGADVEATLEAIS